MQAEDDEKLVEIVDGLKRDDTAIRVIPFRRPKAGSLGDPLDRLRLSADEFHNLQVSLSMNRLSCFHTGFIERHCRIHEG